ncbi:MAG TPA: PAS domain-containing protein, partial [Caulobacteraceae bacterium]|nr:PAS domain-containing protein [Caulobacteraceae bacterium]
GGFAFLGRLTLVHSNTEHLLDYWRSRRGDHAAPRRSDVDPADFARLLPRVFIAELRASDAVFRLAGEAICELHGRSLGGESLLSLWRHDHRRHLLTALDASLRTARPVVVGAEPGGDSEAARLEMLFAPLVGPDETVDRFLGLYQPVAGNFAAPLDPLAITSLAGAPVGVSQSPLRLAAVDGRRIA